jgi:elongation factor G
MAIDISRIRNVGFVGHGGVGKTSLVEAILFRNGVTSRLGRVDDGTATTDFDPEEVKRKISINIGVAHCDYRDHRFNLVDMPGYGDFIAEARAGLRVVEGAVLVVDAVAGVEVQTEKVSKFAQEYGLPRLVFVNRMDRERADFARTLESIQRRLKGRFVPLHVPIGQETGFRGLVDVLRMKGYVLGGAPGKVDETEIPAELAETVQSYRDKLIEAVAESDDDLLARYLDEGTLDDAEVIKALRAAIADGRLVPVICGSATKAIGVRSLLDIVIDSFPSPADRPAMEGTDPRTKEPTTRAASPKEPLAALVFKTLTDPHVGKLTLFRVFSGVLAGNSQVYNASREVRERVGQVALLQGREHKGVDALGPGQIGVVLKLRETLTGDTLCAENAPIVFPRIQFAEPAISFALQPKAKGDEDKISNALARLAEEDPTLRYHYDPETKQILISGVGKLHIEVTL